MRHFALKYHKEKMFAREKGQEDQRWTQGQKDGLVCPHLSYKEIAGPAWARPLPSLPQMASWWHGHGYYVHGHCLGASCASRWKSWGLRASLETSTISKSHLGIPGSHFFFIWGPWVVQKWSNFLSNREWPPHTHFPRTSEIQLCVVLWVQLLDKCIWTSSGSHVQAC